MSALNCEDFAMKNSFHNNPALDVNNHGLHGMFPSSPMNQGNKNPF
jgi:hypothetical protein